MIVSSRCSREGRRAHVQGPSTRVMASVRRDHLAMTSAGRITSLRRRGHRVAALALLPLVLGVGSVAVGSRNASVSLAVTDRSTSSAKAPTSTSTSTPAPAPEPAPAPDSPGRIPRDNPDPFVVRDDDQYLAFFTQGRSNVPLRVSTDWESWSKPVDVLPVLPSWARPGRTWAPAVAETDGVWVLYFTAWHASSGRQCIGSATAASPHGPFDPSAEPLVCQLDLGGSIDPSPFTDVTGSYLLWKSDENAIGLPARVWSAPLASSGTALSGRPVALLSADHAWEAPLIENPAMVAGDDGRHWLFYSAGPWATDRYATGVARCDGPLGPCRKLAHDLPWLASVGDMVGPGGLDSFVSARGERMVGLHAWLPGAVGYESGGQRSLRIGHLDLTGELPTFRQHVE